MTFVLGDAPVFEAIEDGLVLAAEMIGAEIKEMPWKKDNSEDNDTRLVVTFKVTDQDSKYLGRRVTDAIPPDFHNKSKFYFWTCALLGVDELPKGFELSLEDLLDCQAHIEIGARPRKDKDGEEVLRNYIKRVTKLVPDSDEPF